VINRRIVRRYAGALFGAASKAGLVDRIESDLGLVSYALETSPKLMDAVRSPVLPPHAKRELIRAVLGDKLHETTLSYLYLLVDHNREEAILQTEEEYVVLANEARGVVSAEVVSAVALTEDEEVRLREKLSAITGKSVELDKRVDPELIGGVLVKMDDRVIDGSIRGQLEALRDTLVG
jgi:F-type H+-transporting ATPase subunit delta